MRLATSCVARAKARMRGLLLALSHTGAQSMGGVSEVRLAFCEQVAGLVDDLPGGRADEANAQRAVCVADVGDHAVEAGLGLVVARPQVLVQPVAQRGQADTLLRPGRGAMLAVQPRNPCPSPRKRDRCPLHQIIR
ncbi:hypothetical protein EDD96_6227 [Streptomyces sp. Ag109_G2-6]|nr:hypothetical protein EDD96_6227 [Streptomyces sp. Ag109_G2-6]